jgi:hypothetical protein
MMGQLEPEPPIFDGKKPWFPVKIFPTKPRASSKAATFTLSRRPLFHWRVLWEIMWGQWGLAKS